MLVKPIARMCRLYIDHCAVRSMADILKIKQRATAFVAPFSNGANKKD